jgi:hypothetical protein
MIGKPLVRSEGCFAPLSMTIERHDSQWKTACLEKRTLCSAQHDEGKV